MSIRTLSSALQKKAEEEVNEVPSRVQEDLQHIKDWLAKQTHLNARTDDQWLLSFLRGCKFSLQKTKDKLDLFYTMRTLAPEFYADRDPFSPEIQDILKGSFLIILPKTSDPAGPRVAICRHKTDAPEKLLFLPVVKVTLMVLEILLLEDDNCTVSGQHVLIDMENIPYKYMMQMTPNLIQKLLICVQNAYPIRLKSIHYINTPYVFAKIYDIIKLFLTEKLQTRINFWTSKNLPSMYKTIPPSILPEEYGGHEGSLHTISAEWKKKIESYRDWFLEDAIYCSDETKRPGKPITSVDMFGVEGSFRKLEVD